MAKLEDVVLNKETHLSPFIGLHCASACSKMFQQVARNKYESPSTLLVRLCHMMRGGNDVPTKMTSYSMIFVREGRQKSALILMRFTFVM